MIKIPNPGRMKIQLVLLFISMILLQTYAKAAEAVHHFVIENPVIVAVGEDCKIKVTAHREDGSLITTARNKIKFYISSSKGLDTKDLRLDSGEADLQLNFSSPDNLILQAIDKNNPDINSSGMMQVKAAVQIKKRGNK